MQREQAMGGVIGLLPVRHDWWLIFVGLPGLWMSERLEWKSAVKNNLGLKHKKRAVTPGYTVPKLKGKQSRTQSDKKHRRETQGR